jgi:hypothetical protein
LRKQFKIRRNFQLPVAGDLIRSQHTGDKINLVHKVTEIDVKGGIGLWINSVRFATTNGGNIVYENGRRSRGFIWSTHWCIVDEYEVGVIMIPRNEYKKINNTTKIEHLLKLGYETYTKEPKNVGDS